MRIKRLEVKGFRGFKEQVVVDFPENAPTVFVGVNGAGKTALLEAAIWCFMEIQYQFVGKKFPPAESGRKDVNIDSDEFADIKVNFTFFQKSDDYIQKLQLNKTLSPVYKFTGGKSQEKDNTTFDSTGIKAELSFFKKMSLPVLVYYPTERAVANTSKKDSIGTGNQFDAWIGALQRNVDFSDFFNWFKKTEDIENEIRLNENINFSHPSLRAAKLAIAEIIDGVSKVRVKRRNKSEIIIEKEGKQLSVNQLSHGEKTLLSLVGDLARRLAIANPELDNPLDGKGVVLIDEIDLHLHPKWQKSIVRKLRNTFPNIQFILTTHSPIIISQLKSESIILLENNQVTPLAQKGINSYGLTVKDALLKVQGTTDLLPAEVESKFRALFGLIDQGKLSEAKQLKTELEHLVEPTHPELLKGDADIKFKELLS